MLEGARHDVAEDEELGVRVGAEAGGRLDAVLVDDAEGPEGLVQRVRRVVRGEAEGVEGVEPVVVGVAALGPRALGDLHGGGGGGGHAAGGGCGFEEGGEGAAEGLGESQGDC